MEEPQQDHLPFQANEKQAEGKKHKPKKKNRGKKDRQQAPSSQPSSPSLNSIPSSVSSKPAHLADSETLSTASLESSKSSRCRRRAPGGGRKNRSKQHIALQQQQDDLEGSQTSRPPLEDVTEKELYGSDGDMSNSYRGEQEQHPEGHPEQEHEQEQSQQSKPSDTGIRSFNIRRSDPKGGRPVGMKPQIKRKGKRQTAQNHCSHCGQSKSSLEGQETSQPETQPRIPRISVKQNPREEPENKQGQEGVRDTEQEEGNSKDQDGQAKEFSIKLDLNLELEIAFKAKVKGEIMLTFMEWTRRYIYGYVSCQVIKKGRLRSKCADAGYCKISSIVNIAIQGQ